MIEVKMNSMDGIVLLTAGKKVEKDIRVTPSESLNYNGEYEWLASVPLVSGVWVCDEYLVGAGVEFEERINGTLFDSSEAPFYAMLFGGVDDDYEVVVYKKNGYVPTIELGESFTIDFGTEPQEVSEEFYAWLTANAVKQ